MRKLLLATFYFLTGISGVIVSAYFLFNQFKGKTESSYLWIFSVFIGALIVVFVVNVVSGLKKVIKKRNLQKLSRKHFRLKMLVNFIAITMLNFIGIHYLIPIRERRDMIGLLIDVGQSVFIGLIVTFALFGIYKYLDQGLSKTES